MILDQSIEHDGSPGNSEQGHSHDLILLPELPQILKPDQRIYRLHVPNPLKRVFQLFSLQKNLSAMRIWETKYKKIDVVIKFYRLFCENYGLKPIMEEGVLSQTQNQQIEKLTQKGGIQLIQMSKTHQNQPYFLTVKPIKDGVFATICNSLGQTLSCYKFSNEKKGKTLRKLLSERILGPFTLVVIDDSSDYEEEIIEWRKLLPQHEKHGMKIAYIYFNKVDQKYQLLKFNENCLVPSKKQQQEILKFYLNLKQKQQEFFKSIHRGNDRRIIFWDYIIKHIGDMENRGAKESIQKIKQMFQNEIQSTLTPQKQQPQAMHFLMEAKQVRRGQAKVCCYCNERRSSYICAQCSPLNGKPVTLCVDFCMKHYHLERKGPGLMQNEDSQQSHPYFARQSQSSQHESSFCSQQQDQKQGMLAGTDHPLHIMRQEETDETDCEKRKVDLAKTIIEVEKTTNELFQMIDRLIVESGNQEAQLCLNMILSNNLKQVLSLTRNQWQ